MTDALPPLTMWRWLAAVLPVVLLAALVVHGRIKTTTAALATTATAIAIAVAAFGAGAAVVAVGLAKGLWTGVWILYVIWPALLLYHLAARVGLSRMGAVFASVLPRDIENILIVAWVFPSFIQGVAGFGTPIAVAAPLLISMGVGRVRAVALPLIGYHWAVTFGSMGSSFYMGALTARVTGESLGRYADDAAIVLGVNLLIAGALVCLMYGGLPALRSGARMLAVVGTAMALALFGAVQVEPSIGSLSAGAAGIVAVVVLRLVTTRARATLPERPVEPGDDGTAPRPGIVLAPYAILLVVVLTVFVPPAPRTWVKTHLLVAPGFPATNTTYGLANAAVDQFTPIPLLGHPGTYLLVAAGAGLLVYRFSGVWPASSLRATLGAWFAQSRRSSVSVLVLAALALLMVDSGMVRTIAVGAADLTGGAYPVVAPLVGLLGSFTTGSTTSSNALFSALQRDVALLIEVHPAELLAAQTAGGNVGNSLAPVVLLLGATAAGATHRVGEVLRAVLVPAGVLVASVVAVTLLLIAVR